MTDIGSIIPDTAKTRVASDLVHPQQVQNGNAAGHLPTDSHHDGQLEPADQKVNDQFGNGQAEKPAKSKAGIMNTILTAPVKGPRNGIHWGAGVQFSQLFYCMHPPASSEGSLLQAPRTLLLLPCLHSCSDLTYCGIRVCRPNAFSSREGQEQLCSSSRC